MKTRNQYKLLAEKYQLIQEDDRDDIMAGLDTLTDSSLVYYIVYGFDEFATYYVKPINSITAEELKKAFKVDTDTIIDYIDYNSKDAGPIKLTSMISRLNENKLVHLEDKKGKRSIVLCKDMGHLERYFYNWQIRHGYADEGDVVQEDNKEDILTGLEDLDFNPNEPVTEDNVWKLGFEITVDWGNFVVYDVPGDEGSDVSVVMSRPEGSQPVWFVQNTWDTFAKVSVEVSTLGELRKQYEEFKVENINKPFNA